MTLESLLIIFVGVTALSFLIQAILIWRTLDSANQLIDGISKAKAGLDRDVRQVIQQLQQVTSGLDHVRNSFADLGERAGEVNLMFEARARDLDQLVQKIVDVGSRQADRFDAVVADTVSKFEETTEVIQADILRPVVEISSVIRGLKTGFDYLFSKKATLPKDPEAAPDDMFI